MRSAGLLFFLGVAASAGAQDDNVSWRLSGYYLSRYSHSETVVGAPRPFDVDLNRVRLRLQGRTIASLDLEIQYDNELLVGGFVDTDQFAVDRVRRPLTSFDLNRTYVQRSLLAARHELHRAFVRWRGDYAEVTAGRQRIPLGVGRFWNPLDVLSPIEPGRVERDERVGADAAVLEVRFGAFTRAGAVFSPATHRSRRSIAGYVRAHARGVDYTGLAGVFRNELAVGGDAAGQIGGAGVRAEAIVVQPSVGAAYARVMAGSEAGIGDALRVTGEVYYDGEGASSRATYDLAGLLAGRRVSLARHYGGLGARYEATPLLALVAYAVVNLDDRSTLIWPGFEYSVAANVTASVSLQHFAGSPGAEFAFSRDAFHVQLQCFF